MQSKKTNLSVEVHCKLNALSKICGIIVLGIFKLSKLF